MFVCLCLCVIVVDFTASYKLTGPVMSLSAVVPIVKWVLKDVVANAANKHFFSFQGIHSKSGCQAKIERKSTLPLTS